MLLRDLIAAVPSTPSASATTPSFRQIAQWLGYDNARPSNPKVWEGAVSEVLLAPIQCTDQLIGTSLVSLYGVPVVIATQPTRTSDISYQAVSASRLALLQEFVLSLISRRQQPQQIADLDVEMGEGYTVAYPSQLPTDNVLYNGRPATVLSDYGAEVELDDDANWDWITIQCEDDESILDVHISAVLVPYYTLHK